MELELEISNSKRHGLEIETFNSNRHGLEVALDNLKTTVGFNAWNFKALYWFMMCYEKKGMIVDTCKVLQYVL